MLVRETLEIWPAVRDAAAMSRNLRAPRTASSPAERAYAGHRFEAERESPWKAFALVFAAGVAVGSVLVMVVLR
jgi:hypothetical protein